MTSVAHSQSFQRLTLTAPCPVMPLAASILARHLKISPAEAETRLAKSPSTLSDAIDLISARRLAVLLSSIGAQVRLDPATEKHAVAYAELLDISIQPVGSNALDQLAASVALFLPAFACPEMDRDPEKFAQKLASPGGLLIEGATRGDLERTRKALRSLSGLRIASSNPLLARYDVLIDPKQPQSIPSALRKHLRRLGLGFCRLTGAVAARVDRRTCDHLLQTFPNQGLIAFNQDFQRFDLFLTGTCNISPRELADFLVARSDLPRSKLEQMPYPLRIETGLTRAHALAFQADYAALGLETQARLRVFYPVRCPNADQIAPSG